MYGSSNIGILGRRPSVLSRCGVFNVRLLGTRVAYLNNIVWKRETQERPRDLLMSICRVYERVGKPCPLVATVLPRGGLTDRTL